MGPSGSLLRSVYVCAARADPNASERPAVEMTPHAASRPVSTLSARSTPFHVASSACRDAGVPDPVSGGVGNRSMTPRITSAATAMITAAAATGSQSARTRHPHHRTRSQAPRKNGSCRADCAYTSRMSAHHGGRMRWCRHALNSTTTQRSSGARSSPCSSSRRKLRMDDLPEPHGPCRCSMNAPPEPVSVAPRRVGRAARPFQTSSMRVAMHRANGRRASVSSTAGSSGCAGTVSSPSVCGGGAATARLANAGGSGEPGATSTSLLFSAGATNCAAEEGTSSSTQTEVWAASSLAASGYGPVAVSADACDTSAADECVGSSAGGAADDADTNDGAVSWPVDAGGALFGEGALLLGDGSGMRLCVRSGALWGASAVFLRTVLPVFQRDEMASHFTRASCVSSGPTPPLISAATACRRPVRMRWSCTPPSHIASPTTSSRPCSSDNCSKLKL